MKTAALSSNQRVRLAAALVLFSVHFPCASNGQVTAPTTNARIQLEERLAAKRQAYVTFKAGDPAGAIAKLTGSLQKFPSAWPDDFELGRQLAEVSLRFRNDGDHRLALSVSHLAIERLANADSRMAPLHAGTALTLAGGLFEYVWNDVARARQAYQRASELNPHATLAKERLARLQAIDANAESKAAANRMLLERNATKGKR